MSAQQSDNAIQPSSAFTRMWAVIFLFVALLVAILVAAGFNQTQAQNTEPQATFVDTQTVSVQSRYSEQSLALGIVESAQAVSLGFELAGQVESLLVDEGALVAKGQPLAKLDTRRIKAQLGQAQASLAKAQADARLSQVTLERTRSLVKQQLESPQVLDQREAQQDAAQAQVVAAQAAIDALAVELDKSTLIAPFDAVIDARMLDEGSVVNAGTPVFRLTDNLSLDGRFSLPADQAVHFTAGDKVSVWANKQRVQGEVVSVTSTRDRQTRTVDVLVRLPAKKGSIQPGDMASLDVTVSHETQGVWLPVTALSNGLRGLWTVYVAPGETTSALESRTVEVVYTDGDRAYVRGALRQGEHVVVNGTQRLVPGQLVSVLGDGQLAKDNQG